jgi:NarL family two-component system response regulator LiaR
MTDPGPGGPDPTGRRGFVAGDLGHLRHMSANGGRPIRVSIVNDFEIVVRGLEAMLAPFSDRVTVVEVEAGGLPSEPTDVALFDTFAGRRRSLSRVDEMAADYDIGKVVLYTWDVPDAFLRDIDSRSVDGVILKGVTAEQLVTAIERVHRGEPIGIDRIDPGDTTPELTEREREVLALIALGCSNRQIASELYLSLDTVKTHVRKLFAKLGVNNRTQAAMAAHEHGVAATWRDRDTA